MIYRSLDNVWVDLFQGGTGFWKCNETYDWDDTGHIDIIWTLAGFFCIDPHQVSVLALVVFYEVCDELV